MLGRIRYRAAKYRPVEERIASAILADPDGVTREGVVEFAQRNLVSTGSVVRFAKGLGFAGFAEMKVAIARDLPSMTPARERAPESPFRQRMDEQMRALVAASQVDPLTVTRAARLLAGARHVDLAATGSSATLAHSMLFSLNVLGVHARHLPDSSEHAAAAALLGQEDVLVAISFSGRTRGTVDAAARAREAGATVLALTCATRSPLLAQADLAVVLNGAGREEWPLRTGLFAVARALTLEVADHLRPAELQRRRARWSSGRFGIRYDSTG